MHQRKAEQVLKNSQQSEKWERQEQSGHLIQVLGVSAKYLL